MNAPFPRITLKQVMYIKDLFIENPESVKFKALMYPDGTFRIYTEKPLNVDTMKSGHLV